MRPTDPKRNLGFTLIELLVVISIIALLVAILLPALKQARRTAQVAESMSNVRQIQIALHTYANDNDGSMPYLSSHTYHPNPNPVVTATWAAMLSHTDYVQDLHVFWSSARLQKWFEDDIAAMRANAAQSNWLAPGYGANASGVMPSEGSVFQGNPIYPRRLGRPNNPPASKLLTMTEAFHPNSFPEKDGHRVISGASTESARVFSYNGSSVQAFFDSHAVNAPTENLDYRADSPRTGQWLGSSGVIFGEEPWYDMRD